MAVDFHFQISSNHLQVRYDLGDGDNILALPNVNISDGLWHDISLSRFGNQIILKLDNGDRDHYAEAWPSNSFHLLALDGSAVFGAAQVSYNPWSGEAYVTKALRQSKFYRSFDTDSFKAHLEHSFIMHFINCVL